MKFQSGEKIPNFGVLQRFIKKTKRWRVRREDGSTVKLSEEEISALLKGSQKDTPDEKRPVEPVCHRARSVSVESGEGEEVCRFCGKGADEGPLCNPCHCSGSQEFIHMKCLEKIFDSGADWCTLKCKKCNHPYQGREVLDVANKKYEAIIFTANRIIQNDISGTKIAEFLATLGEAYGNLGDYQKMAEVTERAFILMEKTYEDDDPAVSRVLTNLRIAYGRINERPMTIKEYEQILVVEEQVHGSNHRNLVEPLQDLGNAYGKVGDHDNQCKYLERALAIVDRISANQMIANDAVFNLIEDLAYAYSHLGEKKKECELRSRMESLRNKVS